MGFLGVTLISALERFELCGEETEKETFASPDVEDIFGGIQYTCRRYNRSNESTFI